MSVAPDDGLEAALLAVADEIEAALRTTDGCSLVHVFRYDGEQFTPADIWLTGVLPCFQLRSQREIGAAVSRSPPAAASRKAAIPIKIPMRVSSFMDDVSTKRQPESHGHEPSAFAHEQSIQQ